MIIIAASILMYNNKEDERVVDDNKKVIEILERNIETKEIKENNENKDIIQKEIEYVENDSIKETNESIFQVDGNKYIGILYIPSLNNLTIPIIEDWSYQNLKISACKYYGDIKSNNLVIAGHNYKSTFSKLFKLAEGNHAYFKTINGLVYEFKLDKIEILAPSEVDKMKNSNYELTIFTCTYGGQNRYTLRFSRI